MSPELEEHERSGEEYCETKTLAAGSSAPDCSAASLPLFEAGVTVEFDASGVRGQLLRMLFARRVRLQLSNAKVSLTQNINITDKDRS